MFENTPFEAIARTMQDSAGKFNPAAAQEAIKPVSYTHLTLPTNREV